MLQRYRLLSTLAVLCMLASASVAWASKPAPIVEPVPDPGTSLVRIGAPLSPTAICRLGESRAPAFIVNYLLPPNDQYYTLIRPSSCTACATPGGVELKVVHVVLFYPAPCTIPVSISIVGARGTPNCRVPDPSQPLCGPVNVTLTGGAVGLYEFAIALPPGCCIAQDAFLCVNFVADGACNTSSTRPRLVTSGAPCNLCESYNIFTAGGGGNDDLCAIGFPGNPIMNVEADCCFVVPTGQKSWGSVKIRYRD